jgi:hypothetical protein
MSEEMKSKLVVVVFRITPLGNLNSIEAKGIDGGLIATKPPVGFSLSFLNQ